MVREKVLDVLEVFCITIASENAVILLVERAVRGWASDPWVTGWKPVWTTFTFHQIVRGLGLPQFT